MQSSAKLPYKSNWNISFLVTFTNWGLQFVVFVHLPWLDSWKLRSTTGKIATYHCLAQIWSEMWVIFARVKRDVDPICSSQVKKAAAETEKAWEGAGQKVGLQIWRIVKFKVWIDSCSHLLNNVPLSSRWLLQCFIVGDWLAKGGLRKVLQWRLLHYFEYLQEARGRRKGSHVGCELKVILTAGLVLWCTFLDWPVLHPGWVWHCCLQDCGAGYTGKNLNFKLLLC